MSTLTLEQTQMQVADPGADAAQAKAVAWQYRSSRWQKWDFITRKQYLNCLSQGGHGYEMRELFDHPPHPQPSAEEALAKYEMLLADYRRIAREMDIALNGESAATRQASLSEILAQLQCDRSQPEPNLPEVAGTMLMLAKAG